MINVLIIHACGDGNEVRRMIALVWLEEFILLHSIRLLPHLPAYLTAVLPFLDDPKLRGF